MDNIMPAQFDELFDNYIHVTQRLMVRNFNPNHRGSLRGSEVFSV